MYFPGNLIGRLGSVIERNQTRNKIWSIERSIYTERSKSYSIERLITKLLLGRFSVYSTVRVKKP